MEQHAFTRTEMLIGKEALDKLKKSKVVVFGVGGVGSFVVEALTRSGVGNIIIVDKDTVDVTNLNRQIHAIRSTVGKPKVQLMKERIESINPECNVTARQMFVNAENICEIVPEDADYVVDAIDTVTSKIALVMWCKEKNIKIICSMGTGNKLDPTQFKIADIYKTKVCPLAKVMRHELKKRNIDSLKVLYSEEVPRKPLVQNSDGDSRKQSPASISFVPPVAGMIIAGEVIKDITGIR